MSTANDDGIWRAPTKPTVVGEIVPQTHGEYVQFCRKEMKQDCEPDPTWIAPSRKPSGTVVIDQRWEEAATPPPVRKSLFLRILGWFGLGDTAGTAILSVPPPSVIQVRVCDIPVTHGFECFGRIHIRNVPNSLSPHQASRSVFAYEVDSGKSIEFRGDILVTPVKLELHVR